MQIINPGQSLIQPRAKAHTVINPKSPTKPVRVQLTRDCVLWQGSLGKRGDVIEGDVSTPEGYELIALLLSSTSARKVALDTPLRDSPPPEPPKPMIERFLELVSVGLNSIGDLAQELAVSKGAVAALAKDAVESGLVTINEQGLYVRTSTAKKK